MFDVIASGVALIILAPLALLIALAVKLSSRGPVLFRQTRMGMNFRPFHVLKFRTMRKDAAGPKITSGKDTRVTRAGAILRASKLDELPQLWNVFCGDMSLVGPRPEVPEYVEKYRKEYALILKVRPGITDPASILYRSESELLGQSEDPIRYYEEVLLPQKLAISSEYVRTATMMRDIKILLETLIVCFLPGRVTSPVAVQPGKKS